MRIVALLGLAAGLVCGQVSDCRQDFTFTAAGQVNAFSDNRQEACSNWIVAYESSTFTAVSVIFQSADGALTPGAAVTFTGTTLSGANPATNTVRSLSIFTGYVGWYRMTLNTAMGAGTVRGTLYGFRNGWSAGISATPYNPLVTCPTNLPVTTTAMGLTQLVAPGAAQTITVCHVSEGFQNSVDWQLETSTGAACAGAAVLTGVYKSILGVVIDTPFTLPVGLGLCVNLGAAVTGGGFLIYGQK
jgi:hypothetical protein